MEPVREAGTQETLTAQQMQISRMIPTAARTAARMQETAQRTERVPSQDPVPTQVPVTPTAEKRRDPAIREARNRMTPAKARIPVPARELIRETAETQIREIPIRETAAAAPTREAPTKETPAPTREALTRETAVPPIKEAAAPTREEAPIRRNCRNPAMTFQ